MLIYLFPIYYFILYNFFYLCMADDISPYSYVITQKISKWKYSRKKLFKLVVGGDLIKYTILEKYTEIKIRKCNFYVCLPRPGSRSNNVIFCSPTYLRIIFFYDRRWIIWFSFYFYFNILYIYLILDLIVYKWLGEYWYMTYK